MADAEREDVIQQIFEDYRASRDFFDDNVGSEGSDLPIETVMSGMDFISRPKSLFLTLGTALNFQKEAITLRKRTAGLWETEHWIYQPQTLIEGDRYHDLVDLFKGRNEYENHPVLEEHGRMEHGERDAEIWYTVAATLYEQYESNPMTLLEAYEFDAKSIFDHVQEARREPAHESIEMTKAFPYLGGDKVGPLWLRLLDDMVHPLERIHLLPLPVDRQIVKITNYLFDTEYSLKPSEAEKNEIREIWYPRGKEHGLSAAEVDDALWRIAEEGNWEDGGREYVERLTA